MRKLTKEEADKIPQKRMGKKHPVRAMIEELQEGERLQVSREDFNWKKRSPCVFTNEIERKTEKKFDVTKQLNNKGWVVKRIG